MKKIIALLLAVVMCLSLCACSASGRVDGLIKDIGTVTKDSREAIQKAQSAYDELADEDKAKVKNYDVLIAAQEEYNRNAGQLVIDGIYHSKIGSYDPCCEGTSHKQFLEWNPDIELDNFSSNDKVCVFAFATLNAPTEGWNDLIQPTAYYSTYLPGNYLQLQLTVAGTDYDTVYELNDYKGRNSNFWSKYESGKYLDDDYVLYAGEGEQVNIVGMFFVKYHDLQKAMESGSTVTLRYGDPGFYTPDPDPSYSGSISGNEIKQLMCQQEIANDLRSKGLLE